MTDERRQTELRKFFFKPDPFWEQVPSDLWKELTDLSFQMQVPKKTLIYSEGSYPKGLYIIRKGYVKVYIINNEGAEQIIYFQGKDEVFGHRAIVSDEPSPVFVESIDDCEIECIPREHFVRCLRESPLLNAAVMSYLGHEFRIFVNKISLFTQKPVSERVALTLLVLNEKFNPNPQFVKVLRFSREDLASYTGTATENFIRQLKILKDLGAIVIKGRKIIIESTDILFERVNL